MSNDDSKPQRQEILAALKPALKETDLIVSALAGTTADTYQVIDRPGNLYLVGMGMVSQVALGLATALPKCRVFALDTDGSMLLAPSILPVIGTRQPKNLYIVVFDNEQLFGSRGGPRVRPRPERTLPGSPKHPGWRACAPCATKLCCARKSKHSWPARDRRCSSRKSKPWPRRGTKNGWTREQIQIRPACRAHRAD